MTQFHPSLQLNKTPWCKHIICPAFSLPVHQVMDTWAGSLLWLLWIVRQNTWLSQDYCNILTWAPMSAVAEPYVIYIFRFLNPPSDSRSGDGSLRPAISKAAPKHTSFLQYCLFFLFFKKYLLFIIFMCKYECLHDVICTTWVQEATHARKAWWMPSDRSYRYHLWAGHRPQAL